ncbi:transposable element Tcb1 transposase [Trichonephila clavipes]|nr:transposable element Tcb1 transposase [Trichonephila clavipes]
MPPRRNKEKFQQLTEFDRGLSAFEKEDFTIALYIDARVKQPNSSTVMRVWKQWTESTEQLEKLAMDDGRIPLTANHRRLRLQWAHEHRAWQADWHQVVFSDESRFLLWNHDGRIRVKRYAGECCLPKCVIECHSGLTPVVIVWSAISYHGRSNLLRTEEYSENESDGGELSCPNLDSDDDIRLRESDCKEYEVR